MLRTWLDAHQSSGDDDGDSAARRDRSSAPHQVEVHGALQGDGPAPELSSLEVESQVAIDALSLRKQAVEALARLAEAALQKEQGAPISLWAAIVDGPRQLPDLAKKLDERHLATGDAVLGASSCRSSSTSRPTRIQATTAILYDWHRAARLVRGDEVNETYPAETCLIIELESQITVGLGEELKVVLPLAVTIAGREVSLGHRILSLPGAEVLEQRLAEDGGYTHAVSTTDRKLSSRLDEPSDSDGDASGTDEADGLDEPGVDAT